MKKGIVKKGQIWKDVKKGNLLRVVGKCGDVRWTTEIIGSKERHHTHEGTILRNHTLIK